MEINVLICDDDQKDIEIIKEDLKIFDFDIECVNDVENIENKYDIVLMDVELNQSKNGIDYVKEKFSNSEVIYITGYSKYCTKVYETNHVYFLLKPYSKEDFENAINKAIKNINEKRNKNLNIKNQDGTIKIRVNDINYVESEKRKVKIYTNNNKYETYNTIKKLINHLPSNFIICHNSFIVNLKNVKRISKNNFVLENDIIVPISQKKYKEVKDKFLSYIGGTYE